MNRLFSFNTDNNCIQVNYDYHPGHTLGQSQVSPDHKFNFIHIPKNASSSIKKLLNHWPSSNFCEMDSTSQHLVILRDPTDRWISGVAEYLVGGNSILGRQNSNISVEEIESTMSTELFQNLLFDFVIFDAHTVPQCRYLQGLDLDTITFFYFDTQVISRLLQYVGEKENLKNNNSSLNNVKKMVVTTKLKNLLKNNTKLQQQIDKHYYSDHQLFDKVTFVY